MEPLHTFILWESGFSHISRILFEISRKFNIKHVEKVTWDPEEVPERLSRIYPNRDFDADSEKTREIGGNNLVLIVATDPNPDIEDEINRNTVSYKEGLRRDGTNYLHASDNEEEGLFNYRGITDRGEDAFFSLREKKPIICIKDKNSTGLGLCTLERPVFQGIDDVFGLLNTYEDWVILRNWEGLPRSITSEGHEDVDILVRDYFRTATLLQAQGVFQEEYRVHNLVKVGDELVPFDIRYVGDGYYDEEWQTRFLMNRVRTGDFYHLCDEDYFWSLLYHALFHKHRLSDEYRQRLTELGRGLPQCDTTGLRSQASAERMLHSYLRQEGITITKPRDRSVTVVSDNARKIYHSLSGKIRFLGKLVKRKRRADLSGIEGLRHLEDNLKSCPILKRNVFLTEHHVIKQSDRKHAFLLEQEATALERLKGYDQFPNVIDYVRDKDSDYLVLSRLPGRDLFRTFRIPPSQQTAFAKELDRIVEILRSEGIVHRDIRPHNLIFSGERLYLIDFQFAMLDGLEIDARTPTEHYILRNSRVNLGGEWRAPDAPLENRDRLAAERIKEAYCRGMTLKGGIMEGVPFLLRNLKRYVNYK